MSLNYGSLSLCIDSIGECGGDIRENKFFSTSFILAGE